MNKMRVSVIGLAHAAVDFHLPGLAQFEDVELSICDIREENRRKAGDMFGVPAGRQYSDYRDMLRNENPEAVYVLMAQYPHGNYKPDAYFRIVNDVIAQKRAILVEKPLAMTPEEAGPLVESAAKAGVINMCSVNRRFYPTVLFARDEVEKHGPIINVNCHFLKSSPPITAGKLDWLTSDLMHSLDLMLYLLGDDVQEFYPAMSRTEDDAEPTAFHVMARFGNGATGIFSSNARSGARRELFELHGVGVSAYIESDPDADDPKKTKLTLFTQNSKGYADSLRPRVLRARDIAGTNAFAACCGFTGADRYFIDCVRGNKRPHCDFAASYRTVQRCRQILDCPLSVTRRCPPASAHDPMT